jgi:tetratricopeptide (TPR) repeat protein
MACIAAVRVLFRLGRFHAARQTLVKNRRLAQTVSDRVLKAQYYLALAWSHQRGASGAASNRATERALSAARECAEDSGDRATLGLLAYRTGGYLTKKGRHQESIDQLLYAVEAALTTGNYDGVQAYCNEVGSVMRRLGPKFYREARSWLLLGIGIARWMKIGRDDAHGEMILGKIYTELGKQPKLARFWLQRAERIAQRSGNQVNHADVKMVWGFWHQRFGTRKSLVETLGQALIEFRGLRDFDCRQKERYMARKFPSAWPDVMAITDATPFRRPLCGM